MPRIELSFAMAETPEHAQQRFLDEVAPELRRKGGFRLCAQHPGHLAFSDNVKDALDVAADAAEGGGLAPLAGAISFIGGRLSAQRLRADFQSNGVLTTVTIKGHVDAELRGALIRLGTPGHWPERHA